MLALLVLQFAPQERSDGQPLDVGLAVQFAVVHDLVEAYAGDTPTARHPSAEQRAAKQAREQAALQRLREELEASSPIIGLIDRYEAQQEPEARFVRVLDKATPKLTHGLNGCLVADMIGMSGAEMLDEHSRQRVRLRQEAGHLPVAHGLLQQACVYAEDRHRDTPRARWPRLRLLWWRVGSLLGVST